MTTTQKFRLQAVYEGGVMNYDPATNNYASYYQDQYTGYGDQYFDDYDGRWVLYIYIYIYIYLVNYRIPAKTFLLNEAFYESML